MGLHKVAMLSALPGREKWCHQHGEEDGCEASDIVSV